MSRETSRKEGVFAKGPVPPVVGMAPAVPSISLPISRLLNDIDEFPKFSHRRQPSGTENQPEDGFDVDQVYAAESDPFCQLKLTAFDVPLLTADRQPNRAVSIARSSSGTTDTSATSVSGKIGPEHDSEDKDLQQTTVMPSIYVPPSQSQLEPESEPEPKLPRCVPLHGTLASLECSRCSYSEPLHSALPLPGEMLPCPSCEGEQDERIESSQRPRSIGFLRASVLLYGEEHRHGDSIGAIVERDLIGRLKDERMDLLVVAGTTLQIPGVKRMIKEFAKVLRTQPLAKKKAPRKSGAAGDVDEKDAAADDEESEDFPIRTILLNRDPPSKGKGGEWANTFDVWVQGDLQEFVRDWVVDGPSPEEMKLPPKAAEVLSVIPPNTQRKMEVTKVEGTKIRLSLEKALPATQQPTRAKRKEPPSPDKSVKGKAKSRAKNPKLGTNIPFPSRKPNIKSPARKLPPPKSQPAPDSPEFQSGSSDVCVFVPYPPPPMGATFAAARSPPRKMGRSRGKPNQTGKQAAQKAAALAPSTPTPKPKPASRPLKPRTAPTRRSTRQANVAQPVTAQLTLPPVTPRKRNFASTCSSPLTSVPSSDDEAEDCSSQGMIEDALDVTA